MTTRSGEWGHRVLASGDQSARDLREEGLLTYRGRLVPASFDSIVCPLGTFVYRRPHVLVSGSSGWLRESATDTASARPEPGRPAFAVADAERGWYDGLFLGRKAGTPSDWVWVGITTNGFWLKPRGIFFYSEILAPPRESAK